MPKPLWILIPFVAVFFTSLSGCGCGGFSVNYESGKQGKIVVAQLPQPAAPSRVHGIGDAMTAGQDVLIFRLTRKGASLPHNKRNFFFITKLMESYAPTVKVIELSTSESYPQGDYYAELMDYSPPNGFGVIKKEQDGFKLYSSVFGYAESYEDFVVPVQEKVEEVLGKSSFDKSKLISPTSKYEAYNKARRERRPMILYSFANACNSFPAPEQAKVKTDIIARFSRVAEIFEVDHTSFTDPANEVFDQGQNIVCVYNSRNGKVTPTLFAKSDVLENIQKALDEP
jgi:hypothetical protein